MAASSDIRLKIVSAVELKVQSETYQKVELVTFGSEGGVFAWKILFQFIFL